MAEVHRRRSLRRRRNRHQRSQRALVTAAPRHLRSRSGELVVFGLYRLAGGRLGLGGRDAGAAGQSHPRGLRQRQDRAQQQLVSLRASTRAPKRRLPAASIAASDGGTGSGRNPNRTARAAGVSGARVHSEICSRLPAIAQRRARRSAHLVRCLPRVQGRWIEIHCDSAGSITSARVEQYLLEKSRVVSQAASERSYHVLYMLCEGAAGAKHGLQHPSAYRFLQASGCYTVDGRDELKEYAQVRETTRAQGTRTRGRPSPHARHAHAPFPALQCRPSRPMSGWSKAGLYSLEEPRLVAGGRRVSCGDLLTNLPTTYLLTNLTPLPPYPPADNLPPYQPYPLPSLPTCRQPPCRIPTGRQIP
jgi:hypothetical protein